MFQTIHSKLLYQQFQTYKAHCQPFATLSKYSAGVSQGSAKIWRASKFQLVLPPHSLCWVEGGLAWAAERVGGGLALDPRYMLCHSASPLKLKLLALRLDVTPHQTTKFKLTYNQTFQNILKTYKTKIQSFKLKSPRLVAKVTLGVVSN